MTPEKIVADYEDGALSLGETMARLIFSLEHAEPQRVLSQVRKAGLFEPFIQELNDVDENTTWTSMGSGSESRLSPAAWRGVVAARTLYQSQTR